MAAVTVETEAVANGLMIDQYAAGVPYCRTGKYVNSGAKDADSVIQAVIVPKGAKLVRVEYGSTALGAGRTIDIGTATTVDKYVDGADVASAATGSVILNETLAEDTTIQVKVLGDTLPDGAEIYVHAWYKMAGSIADEA